MAIKGEKLTDFITAPWYNHVSRATGIHVGIPPLQQDNNNLYCTVYNHSATPQEIWSAVALGDSKLDYTVPLEDLSTEDFAFDTQDLSAFDPHNLVILQEPLAGEVGASARALVVGCSWLKMSIMKPSTENVYDPLISCGSPDLIYSNTGRIELLREFEYGANNSSAITVGTNLGPIGNLSATPSGPTTQAVNQTYLCYVRINKIHGRVLFHARTDSTGIPGKVGSTMQSNMCERQTVDDTGLLTLTGNYITIFNPSRTKVEADTDVVYAYNEVGEAEVIVEDCGP